MNKELFVPRGLYCLLMTYDPKSKVGHTSADITRFVDSSIKQSSSTSILKRCRLTSNRSHSVELPDAAPLVFPSMYLGDPLFNPIRWTRTVTSNYADRKAQARYARMNPPRALAVMAPAEQTSGGPESWLAVESVDPNPMNDKINTVISNEEKKKATKPNAGTGKRWLKESVLFLMIVNLPTKADLAAMRASNGRRPREV